jgi:hypothetical protein
MLLEKVSIHTQILFVHCYKFFFIITCSFLCLLKIVYYCLKVMFVINNSEGTHLWLFSKNFGKKYSSSVWYIQFTERKNLIDLPYLDDHSFYFWSILPEFREILPPSEQNRIIKSLSPHTKFWMNISRSIYI